MSVVIGVSSGTASLARGDEGGAAGGKEDAVGGKEDAAGDADKERPLAKKTTREPPARPPLPPAKTIEPPPWERHVDFGGDMTFVARLASQDGAEKPTGVRYKPALGFGVHGSFQIVRFLRFSGYFLSSNHTVALPPGSLEQRGMLLIGKAESYSLGARLSPTWPLSDRGRAWITGGIGWGRLEFGRMLVVEPGSPPFLVRERAASFAEVPVGLGISFDVIPRWLAVEVQSTCAFMVGQEGTATGSAQAIDSAGRARSIGGLPKVDATFVQTFGLSIIL